MGRKLILIIYTTIALTFSTFAISSEDLILKKMNPLKLKIVQKNLTEQLSLLTQSLDKIIIKPLASAYNILPSPIRSGVGNSLNNLTHLITIPNNLLQGNLRDASINTGRFLINTTIGILGIFDVADQMGLTETEKEDYGQTLATHGVGPGCYIVLPVLGPSTTRDTVASFTNFIGGDAWYNITVENDTKYFTEIDYYSSKLTSAVDFRAKNFDSIENLEKNSLDFYASVKSLYLQDRQQKF